MFGLGGVWSGGGGCLVWEWVCGLGWSGWVCGLRPPSGRRPPPPNRKELSKEIPLVGRQIPVKTLPSLILRMRPVITEKLNSMACMPM